MPDLTRCYKMMFLLKLRIQRLVNRVIILRVIYGIYNNQLLLLAYIQ